MGRRTLLLIVSILVAAVGVGLVALYVRGAEDRANARAEQIYGPRPTATPTPKVTVPVNQHDDIARRGLTIEVPDPDRVIGLLQPGDRVAVYQTTKDGKSTQIIDTIKVIGVGIKHDVKAATGEEVPLTIVALDASDEQTRAILEAQTGNRVTLVVLGKNP